MKSFSKQLLECLKRLIVPITFFLDFFRMFFEFHCFCQVSEKLSEYSAIFIEKYFLQVLTLDFIYLFIQWSE